MTELQNTQQQTALVRQDAFQPKNFEELMNLAKFFANSSLVPSKMRGNASDIALMIMIGSDLGLTFPQTIQQVFVFDARPTISAKLAHALVLRSGRAKYFRCIESTDQISTWETHRLGEPEPAQLSYTLAMAKRAGMLSKKNWASDPEAMLTARAKGRLAHQIYPDVLIGVDVEGGGSDYENAATARVMPEQPTAKLSLDPKPSQETGPPHDSETGEVLDSAPASADDLNGWEGELDALRQLE